MNQWRAREGTVLVALGVWTVNSGSRTEEVALGKEGQVGAVRAKAGE